MTGTIYGYARKSTASQNIERQIRNITEYCSSAIIYQETYTGTKIDRPEWNKLYKRLQAGDTIIFDSVSRMSRSTEDGMNLYEELSDKGINLVFIKEPHINTATYQEAISSSITLTGNDIADEYIKATNKVLRMLARKQVQQAFEQAQKEVDDLHTRTAEGIKTARINGKQIGRPYTDKDGNRLDTTTKKEKEAQAIIKKYNKTFGGSLSDIDCIKLIGCSRNSYYKYKRNITEI